MGGPLNPVTYSKKVCFNCRKSRTDNYETPAWVTRALIRKLKQFNLLKGVRKIWDPCAGRGAIVAELQRLSPPRVKVIGSDIRKPVAPVVGTKIRQADFLTMDKAKAGQVDMVAMNPPFTLADDFVLESLTVARIVCAFQRTQYIEGVDRYTKLFRNYPPSYMFTFIRRVSMEREGWARLISTGVMTFSWFVWDRDNSGPTKLVWIDDKPDFTHDRRLVFVAPDGSHGEVRDLLKIQEQFEKTIVYRVACNTCLYPLCYRAHRSTELKCLVCGKSQKQSAEVGGAAGSKYDQEFRVL